MLGRAVVFQIAIAVSIAVPVDPLKRPLDIGTEFLEQSEVSCPSSMAADQDQKERGGVDRPIVRGMGDFLQPRQLSDARFVRNLSRLLIPPMIDTVALILG